METYTFQFDPGECRGGLFAGRSCERRGALGAPVMGCAADALGRFVCYRGDPRIPSNFTEYRACVAASPSPYPLCGPTAFTCPTGNGWGASGGSAAWQPLSPCARDQICSPALGPWEWVVN